MQQIFFPSLWNSLSSILAANHPNVRAATIGPWALAPFHECDQPHQRFCHAPCWHHRTALHVWERRFVFWSCEACAAQQNETDRCRAHVSGPLVKRSAAERNVHPKKDPDECFERLFESHLLKARAGNIYRTKDSKVIVSLQSRAVKSAVGCFERLFESHLLKARAGNIYSRTKDSKVIVSLQSRAVKSAVGCFERLFECHLLKARAGSIYRTKDSKVIVSLQSRAVKSAVGCFLSSILHFERLHQHNIVQPNRNGGKPVLPKQDRLHLNLPAMSFVTCPRAPFGIHVRIHPASSHKVPAGGAIPGILPVAELPCVFKVC